MAGSSGKLAEVRATIASACRVNANHAVTVRTVEEREAANARCKSLYAQLDACRIDLEQLITDANRSKAARDGNDGLAPDTAEIEGLRREVEDRMATLILLPVQRKPWALVSTIDFLWRAPACFLFVMFLGFVTSVPLIMLTIVEHQLFLLQHRRNPSRHGKSLSSTSSTSTPGASPAATVGGIGAAQRAEAASSGTEDSIGLGSSGSTSVSSVIKRWDAWWLLLIMGVTVKAEGLSECGLLNSGTPAMLLFSHVSTLDAMIILSTFPRAFCAVVKEELFALPIVGWIMASHGGVPINRRHRASAVQALAEAAERARELRLSVAMAPEGTRSKTGQLGPFKKGALHMQEQLQWPVITVTIRGAYELFPLKAYFNQRGKVIVRYHKPIPASEIKSRDGLAQKVRKKMLEAGEEEAPEAGHASAPSRTVMSFVAVAFTYWAAGRAARMLVAFSRREEVGVWALVAGGFAYMALSTIFVYFVYARRCLGGRSSTASNSSGRVHRDKEVGDGVSMVKKRGGFGHSGKTRGRGEGGGKSEETKRLLGADDDGAVCGITMKGKE